MSPTWKRFTEEPTPIDLAHGRVARVDLAAAHVGDVHRVGQGRVIDVVLPRDGEDLQVHVVRADIAHLQLVEADDTRDVDLGEIVVDALALGGDRFCSNRILSGHDTPRF